MFGNYKANENKYLCLQRNPAFNETLHVIISCTRGIEPSASDVSYRHAKKARSAQSINLRVLTALYKSRLIVSVTNKITHD